MGSSQARNWYFERRQFLQMSDGRDKISPYNRINEARPTDVGSTRRALTPQEGEDFMGADHSILSPRSDSATPTNEGSSSLPKVVIYVDGAAVPNPGNAGIGAVLICGKNRRELSEPIGRATNNAAEIMAAVHALRALKQPCAVTLYSDSQYVISTMRREFKRGSNMALWILLDHAASIHTVEWKWVRGHNGDPNNERANTLANQAVRLNETEGLFS